MEKSSPRSEPAGFSWAFNDSLVGIVKMVILSGFYYRRGWQPGLTGRPQAQPGFDSGFVSSALATPPLIDGRTSFWLLYNHGIVVISVDLTLVPFSIVWEYLSPYQ